MSLKIEAFCVAGLGGKVPIISRAMYIYTNNFVAAMSTTGMLNKLNRVQSQKVIREKIGLGLSKYVKLAFFTWL